MKKRFSLIAAVVFSISLLSFNAGEKRNVQYADMSIVVNPPVAKTLGKRTKPVTPPSKKKIATSAVYRTMA